MSKTPKPKHQTPNPARRIRLAGTLRVGEFLLSETLMPAGIWIGNKEGEGMLIAEAQLEATLTRFWKRNF